MIVPPAPRSLVFAVLLLLTPGALAREVVAGAPWTALKRSADTVGSCATDEFSEITTCTLVRCQPGQGPVFAVNDPTLGDMGVRRVRIGAGGRHQDVTLKGDGPGERWVRLSSVPALLSLLTSGAHEASFRTLAATTDFATSIDLTGAARQIGALLRRCPAP